MSRRHRLVEMDWPEFGAAQRPPGPEAAELLERIAKAREAMERERLTYLVVYGDREHFANLAYLTGFDPRFEEAVLILSADRAPLLVVGNECEGYLGVSPLWREGQLRKERFQPFSLLNQPRNQSRRIAEIFGDEGISDRSRVGCVGWKYFSESEHPDAAHAVDIPAYLADTLRGLAGRENVVNAAALFMDPAEGLRARCSPSEIAYFEFTNVEASEAMKRMLFALREGMTDYEAVQEAKWNGEPLGCHLTFCLDGNPGGGLAGPAGYKVRRGGRLSANVCYWGANICRAGWIAESAEDLPAAARDYIEAFAGPYLQAMAGWFGGLRIGTPGSEIYRRIHKSLPFEKFGIFLNPGHLIHLDEWVSSPVFEDSAAPIESGMAIQTDVIPSSETYFSTRMEDGVVVADSSLRAEIRSRFPDCFARMEKRREFMAASLGLELPEEVLPLSNMAGIIPPFFLAPRQVLSLTD